jgi:hypothetical protein
MLTCYTLRRSSGGVHVCPLLQHKSQRIPLLSKYFPSSQVRVKVVVELTGRDHAEKVQRGLTDAKFPFVWGLVSDDPVLPVTEPSVFAIKDSNKTTETTVRKLDGLNY